MVRQQHADRCPPFNLALRPISPWEPGPPGPGFGEECRRRHLPWTSVKEVDGWCENVELCRCACNVSRGVGAMGERGKSQATTSDDEVIHLEDDAIRPFHVDIPEEDLVDLRRAWRRRAGPNGDRRRPIAGRAARDDAGARALLGHRLRPPAVRDEAERGAAVPDRDRRARHPLHPRQVAARERAAADHHPRLARLDHRDAERGRPAHRPDGARRRRGGCVRRGGSVDARLRVLGEADDDRLGPRPHRGRLDRADAAPGIPAFRRAGRRLGRADHGRDRCEGTSGVARHPLEHARHRPARRLEGAHVERLRDRATRRRPVCRPTSSARTTG